MKKRFFLILVAFLVLGGCTDKSPIQIIDSKNDTEKFNIDGSVEIASNETPVVSEKNEKADNTTSKNNAFEITTSQGALSINNEQPLEIQSRIIKDNIHELNSTVLQKIIQSFFLSFEFHTKFNSDEKISFGNAFYYIASAGTYSVQPVDYQKLFENYFDSNSGNYIIPLQVVDELIFKKRIESVMFSDITINNGNYIVKPSDRYMRWDMRSEIYQYFNKETEMIEIPSHIVDEYIVSKFNTTIDHSLIKEYDKVSDTYSYYPFMGEFYYDISIDEVIIDGNIVKLTSTLTENTNENPNRLYQATFTIEFKDGEYKFLSVDVVDFEEFTFDKNNSSGIFDLIEKVTYIPEVMPFITLHDMITEE